MNGTIPPFSSHGNSRHGHSRHGSRHGGDSSSSPSRPMQSVQRQSSASSVSSLDALMSLPDLPTFDIASFSPQLEETLQTATDTIDNLNNMFDYYSRHYLGTIYAEENGHHAHHSAHHDFSPELAHDEQPASLLPELPQELANLDLDSVEVHLRSCGGMSANFLHRLMAEKEQRLRNRQKQQWDLTLEEDEKEEMQTFDMATNVPEIFFSPYFDLTDPKTFESLLVLDDNNNDDNNHDNDDEEEEDGQLQISTSSPISQIIRLPNPSTLTSHLDEIELNLLDQVRSKSSSFFRETTRFSTLKALIATSVSDVMTLRKDIAHLQSKLVTDVECIPNMDRQRDELKLLGKVADMVSCVSDCKNSIAGLMAAGDYLGAVEAIFVARNLLQGKHTLDEESPQSSEIQMVELGKLKALSKVSEQLQQYEQLAVTRLTNELVDVFLNWNANSPLEKSTSASNFSSMDHTSTTTAATLDDVSSTTTPTTTTAVPNAQHNLRSRVRNIVSALRTCSQLENAAKAYKDKLCEVVKVTVRTTVTECAADISTTTSNTLISASSSSSNSATISSKEEKKEASSTNKSSITAGVTSMSFPQFLNCLDMLLEQVLVLLRGAVGVQKFLREEAIMLMDVVSEAGSTDTSKLDGNEEVEATPTSDVPPPPTPLATTPRGSSIESTALSASSELAHKSISELLRLRKDSHSLITFDEMKLLWDTSLAFTLQLEKYSGRKAYNLRGTLLAQAKAFVERKHEANMASLVAALDGERWTQCDVTAERQAALTRLCSGRAVLSTNKITNRRGNSTGNDPTNITTTTSTSSKKNKMSDAEVEGKRYKVVWSCLLLVEMVMSNVACAAHFQTLATNVVGKVVELLRLFNSRSTHLVLMAGAIHSAARLKSINAKHLALVTQCLGLVIGTLPHVRAALMAQLPSKQHTLLVDLDRVKKEYADHNEKVLSKFVSIIGGIVEHALAPRIGKTDFDARAKKSAAAADGSIVTAANVVCCPFLEGISSNTKKMHQVLSVLLPEEHLQDVFSRIFAYVDSKVPSLFITASAASASEGSGGAGGNNSFSLPQTDDGKRRMVLEVEAMSNALNRLSGVQPWDFSAMKVLEKKLDINLDTEGKEEQPDDPAKEAFGNKEDMKAEDSLMNGEDGVKESNGDKTHEREEGDGSDGDAETKESLTENANDVDNTNADNTASSSAAVEITNNNGLSSEGEQNVCNGEKDSSTATEQAGLSEDRSEPCVREEEDET